MNIISLSMGLFVSAILGLGVVTFHTNSHSLLAKFDRSAEVEELRNVIRAGLSCEQTVEQIPSNCRAGENILLHRKDGEMLFRKHNPNNKVMVLGNYFVRAKCTVTENEFKVQYRHKKTTGYTHLFNDLNFKCEPPPAPVSGWVQTNGGHCPTVCSNLGLNNTRSRFGYRCMSGEIIPTSAWGKIGFTHGCWPYCTPNHWWSHSNSEGPRCYGRRGATPQPRDHDATDITVGCHCG